MPSPMTFKREMKFGYIWGTGRRKSSVARVRVRPGSGEITINKRKIDDYFPRLDHRNQVTAPLRALERAESYDVFINVKGGGITGQAGACLLGVARALVAAEGDEETHHKLKQEGHLTRDPRKVERKKYGQRGARRKFQFSKR